MYITYVGTYVSVCIHTYTSF